MRAPTLVAGVLAQLQELLDVEVPRFEVAADGSLALAALVHGDRGVIDDLQERHHTLAFAIGPLDMAAQGTHGRPVVAKATRVFGEQGVFLDRFVNAVEVVLYGRQVARRKLRVQRSGVEQGGRRTHEVEGRQDLVELDGASFAVDLVERQTHGDAHEEDLRQLDALSTQVQKVAVIQRLQAEVVELQIARGVESLGQTRQVVARKFGIEQPAFHATLDEAREIAGVGREHLFLRHVFTQNFLADRVQQ